MFSDFADIFSKGTLKGTSFKTLNVAYFISNTLPPTPAPHTTKKDFIKRKAIFKCQFVVEDGVICLRLANPQMAS